MIAHSLLTVSEAAACARVHVGTMRAWIRTGAGPAVTRLNGKQLISETSLSAWIEARTTTVPSRVAA